MLRVFNNPEYSDSSRLYQYLPAVVHERLGFVLLRRAEFGLRIDCPNSYSFIYPPFGSSNSRRIRKVSFPSRIMVVSVLIA